ncbi:MAG: 50S ribosomal protein L32, partial [Pedobacter sp.]
MAHPKRKISKSRRDKRRTHYKAVAPGLTTCQTTGAVHLPHRAYTVDGNLYYNG